MSLCRTAADALRFNNRNVAQAAATKASGIFKATASKRSIGAIKGNRPVTGEM
jgi:hypothetical protein